MRARGAVAQRRRRDTGVAAGLPTGQRKRCGAVWTRGKKKKVKQWYRNGTADRT